MGILSRFYNVAVFENDVVIFSLIEMITSHGNAIC